jgi:hypothetical protein
MSSDQLPARTMIRPHEGVIRETPPDPKHNEYPKHMNHPGYRPASLGEEVVHPSGKFKYWVGGTSVAWPPVLAMNADQEDYHESQGYVVQGKSSPEAFARAVRAEPVSNQDHIEYPKYVGGVLVNDAAQEARARAKLGAQPALSAEGGEVKSAAQLVDEAHADQDMRDRITAIADSRGEIKSGEQVQIEALQAQMSEMNANMAKLLALVSGSPVAPVAAAPPTEPEAKTAAPTADGLSHGEKIRLGKLRKAQERATQAGDRKDEAA